MRHGLSVVRPMHDADLPAVGKLAGGLLRLHHAWDPARFFSVDDPETGYARFFGSQLRESSTVLLVAEVEATIVGYCYGGMLVWQSAAKLDGLSAAVSYYGGGVQDQADLTAKCPTMLHFGEKDHAIPIDKVKAFMARQPNLKVHIYDANHGFNCNHRGSYDAAAAKTALDRTLAFFSDNLGK